MCNVATKSIITLALSMAAVACGPDNGEKEAASLVAQARVAVDASQFARAKTLVDSVNNAYPRAIQARREAMHIGALAIEGLTAQKLQTADSLLAQLAAKAEELKPYVEYVSNPIEGYYIAKGAKADDILNSTGLQARLSPEGDFYIISNLKGKGVKSTSITVTDGAESASTATVAYDGERNDRYGGAERITFIAAECDTVGRFIFDHRLSPITLTFNGEAGSTSMSLPPKTVEQTAALYDYALTMRQARVASLEKERLSRSLDTSRSQAARTYVEKE